MAWEVLLFDSSWSSAAALSDEEDMVFEQGAKALPTKHDLPLFRVPLIKVGLCFCPSPCCISFFGNSLCVVTFVTLTFPPSTCVSSGCAVDGAHLLLPCVRHSKERRENAVGSCCVALEPDVCVMVDRSQIRELLQPLH